MVKSIANTVQSLIDNDLSFQDALRRGYANYSAIARMIKTRVEDLLGREIKLESVVTSVKRAEIGLQQRYRDTTRIIGRSTINLRTDVAKISVERTRWNLGIIGRTLTDLKEAFIQIIEGESAITLIFDKRMIDEIHPLFRKEEILDMKRDLAAIIVQSPREIITTPGCAMALYYPLARRNVNIEETMSCFTDTIIVLPMEDVGKAFTALTNVIADARRQEKR